MGLIDISETQLAFGYFHAYLNVNKKTKFILPSLKQEGGNMVFNYPGADLILQNNHLIQFKRPFFYTTNGIKEFWNYDKPSDLFPPYYRFYLKNSSPTNQLENLIKAARKGFKSEYISPLFHDEATFFNTLQDNYRHLNSYAHIDIKQFDAWLSAIGNTDSHTILYTEDSVDKKYCYCFSEPKRLRATKYVDINEEQSPNENINATTALDLLEYIFWNETVENERVTIIRNSNDNIYNQIRNLQNRLLIEKDIIWKFNIKRN